MGKYYLIEIDIFQFYAEVWSETFAQNWIFLFSNPIVDLTSSVSINLFRRPKTL